MKKLLPASLALATFVFFQIITNTLHASQLPFGFAEARLAQGLDATSMALAPDGRLFVLEKFGQVRIIDSTGHLLPVPFLYIPVDNFNERGLLGIALPPDFEQHPWVYLYYTVPGANHNRVSRFRAVGNIADPLSEEILLELDTLAGPHHNAGAMLFGHDGMLYIATGDGTHAPNSQSFDNLLGKILRIRPDGSIPEDNPFYDQLEGKLRAIYALGFRNPFSMTMDPATGRIFCGDVGGADWEEINEVLPGRNYGWPIIEGFREDENPPDNYQDPVHAYSHAEGCAIVGGAFYTPGQQLFPPEYTGKYFFSDYCSGKIYTLDLSTGAVNTFATQVNRAIHLLTAPDGSMYYIARNGIPGGSPDANTATTDGEVWKIVYTGTGKPFISVQPAPKLVTVGEDVHFEVVPSGTPPFQYQWQRNVVDIPGATARILELFDVTLADSASLFRCIVSNAEGSDTSQAAMLRVTASQRPQTLILSPIDGSRYAAGDTIFFQGMATDAEEGTIPPHRLFWRIDFHHDDHTHPALSPTPGILSGSFVVPRVDETDPDTWYRIYLTATDSSGLSSTTTAEVFPYKAHFTLQSQPAPVVFYLEGNPVQAPAVIESVVGQWRDIHASRHFYTPDSIYVFEKFTNGSTQYHFTYEVPMHDSTFIAVYSAVPVDEGQGLFGQYYLRGQSWFEFEGDPVLVRIDSIVDFDWSGSDPVPGVVPHDDYLVRWEGYLKPLFTGWHQFHITTDDGARFWLDHELLLDKWWLQAPTEHTFEVFLEKGRFYPLRLEYFQRNGQAVIKFKWSNDFIEKSPVPKSQLYPALPASTNEEGFRARLFPNPSTGSLSLFSHFENSYLMKWRLIDAAGKTAAQDTTPVFAGPNFLTLPADLLAPGWYVLVLEAGGYRKSIPFIRLP
ncbi:MAG: hypothetical protein KatS3mg030_352 [Saprospiraceae bacterium]|nr:MAG: hypothetical protein KatS3mg030_352 [Saprospiraceae bacterium]